MFSWVKGRQGTGYQKLKLFQFLNMDCYILRYKEGDFIPEHRDPVPGRKHYRFNIELKKPEAGGIFQYRCIKKNMWITPGRVTLFRSDICDHRVSRIKKGSRYIITFGIAI